MPGKASGSTTRRNPVKREHPNTQAASSSSRGMPMNRLAQTSVAKGVASTACTSATPKGVS